MQSRQREISSQWPETNPIIMNDELEHIVVNCRYVKLLHNCTIGLQILTTALLADYPRFVNPTNYTYKPFSAIYPLVPPHHDGRCLDIVAISCIGGDPTDTHRRIN